jgi:hypothetical protein
VLRDYRRACRDWERALVGGSPGVLAISRGVGEGFDVGLVRRSTARACGLLIKNRFPDRELSPDVRARVAPRGDGIVEEGPIVAVRSQDQVCHLFVRAQILANSANSIELVFILMLEYH